MIRKYLKGILSEVLNAPTELRHPVQAMENMMDNYGMTALRVFKCNNGFLVRIEGNPSMTFCEKMEDVVTAYITSEAQRKLGINTIDRSSGYSGTVSKY